MVDPHRSRTGIRPPRTSTSCTWMALALAWEYLRRHPDYRLDWLRRHRRPDSGASLGLAPAGRPGPGCARRASGLAARPCDAVVQLYPDADPPMDADRLRVLAHPRPQATAPRRQGAGADRAQPRPLPALRAGARPGRRHGRGLCPSRRRCRACARPCARCTPGRWPSPGQHLPRCWNCTPCRRSTRPWRARPCASRRRAVRRRCRGRLVQRRRPALQGAPPGAARRCVDARRLSPPSTASAA
jgi:hypothetical protein